jgi:reactive chlorine resistance protein C
LTEHIKPEDAEMSSPTIYLVRNSVRVLPAVDTVAAALLRYGLVIVIGWIGLLKFAHYEAHQIAPLVAHSPFMGWLYHVFPEYTFSILLGVVEVSAAILLAVKPIAPRISALGSLLSVLLFISTITFLFTTPGVSEPAGGGFPAITLLAEFLLKDIVLLGASFWTLADAIRSGWVPDAASLN